MSLVARQFLGVLYGGLVGDVYGALFELKNWINLQNVLSLIKNSISGSQSTQLKYTDDTQMMLSIYRSLRDCSGFNERDLATKFVTNYYEDGLHRRYGGSIRYLFEQIRNNNFYDASKFASEAFDGTGSIGNGAAMRVSAVALYAYSMEIEMFNHLILQVSAVTHSHPRSIYGALLQGHAIRLILNAAIAGVNILNPETLIESLKLELSRVNIFEFVAGVKPHYRVSDALTTMIKKLDTVKKLVLQPTLPKSIEIISQLGNSCLATESVATALYIFLRSLNPIVGIDFQSLPLRCVTYAISLGGDTDTIACLAGNLMGAWVGAEDVSGPDLLGTIHFPGSIIRRCEGYDQVSECSQWLAEHSKQL